MEIKFEIIDGGKNIKVGIIENSYPNTTLNFDLDLLENQLMDFINKIKDHKNFKYFDFYLANTNNDMVVIGQKAPFPEFHYYNFDGKIINYLDNTTHMAPQSPYWKFGKYITIKGVSKKILLTY